MAARLTTYLVVAIVAGTVIAGLIVGAQRDDYEGPVDVIVHNAQVFTADGGAPLAEAVAIRGNQVLRVGSNREIGRLRRPQTTMIDAGGATVLPGFNDAHVRLVDGGLALLEESRGASATGSGDSDLAAVGREDRLEAVRVAIAEAHRFGVTSVHDLGATPSDIAMYDELRRAGDLPLRVYAALELEAPFDEGLLNRLAALWKDFSDDPRFKTGSVTLDLDEDTADADQTAPAMDADELNRFVRLLDAQGWQIVLQADGVETVRMALDAYRHAERSNAAPERGRRHRLTGTAALGEVDRARLGALGVLASMHPAPPAAADEVPAVEAGARQPVRAAAAAGPDGHAVFGSGWPAAALNPLIGLQSSLGGGAATDVEPAATTAADRGHLETAITAYTSAGAFASFDEQRKGTISAGMLADLVVLTDDIFAIPRGRIAASEVAVTIFDGKVVYRRDPRGTN